VAGCSLIAPAAIRAVGAVLGIAVIVIGLGATTRVNAERNETEAEAGVLLASASAMLIWSKQKADDVERRNETVERG
jgi:hypothetical protein